jgi:catechol 2,3-dioxygenase-like lactoylglutathione lyase family enzyme
MAANKKKTTRKPPRSKSKAAHARARPRASRTAVAGMTAATPGLTVADIEKSVAWYRDVMGFVVNERWESRGRLEAVEMRSGYVSFFLAQDNWKKGRRRVKGQGVRIYCSTDRDVDLFAEHVQAEGNTLTQLPTTEMGMRSFSVDDPDGYQITIWAGVKR